MCEAPRRYEFEGHVPLVHKDAFIAPGAFLVGDVEIAERSSVWFMTVLRGDSGAISIGKESNVQDLCLVHGETRIDDRVTVGHGCILNGCLIGSSTLIGSGTTILDGAVIGSNVVVAAGSVIPPEMRCASGTYVKGAPAREVVDGMSMKERRKLVAFLADYYVALAARHSQGGGCRGAAS